MKTTKKIIAVVLSVMLLLSVMPFAAFAAESYTVSTEQELNAAIAAAQSGDTITLDSDIDFTVYPAFTRHTLDLSGVTLDLDGHTITGYNHSVVYVGDNFTIKNGTVTCLYDAATNKKESYAVVVYPQVGNWQTDVVTDKSTGVVLENLVLTGGINCFGADVTVRGENTNVTGNYYYALWADVLSTLTVEEGTFTSAASSTNGIIGACSDAGKEAYVDISGGDYTVPAGKNLVLQSTMASSRQLVEISGGTYNVVVPAKACAEGFVPVTEPNAQGKYTVAVDTAVAEVNGVKYDTFEEALAAISNVSTAKHSKAKDPTYDYKTYVANGTIKLLANTTSNGIIIGSGSNLVIDFNGKTLDINAKPVGSNGTESIALQLLKNSNITFKNGTLTSSYTYSSSDTEYIQRLIQNYSNLTLDNMNVTMTGNFKNTLTISTCNGDFVVKDSTVNAPDFSAYGYTTETAAEQLGVKALAFGTFSGYTAATATVEGNSTINGNVSVGTTNPDVSTNTLALTGGTLNGDILMSDNADSENVEITKANTFTKDAPEGYKWVDNGDGTSTIEKVEEANNGANLTLKGNIEEAIYLDADAYNLGSDAVIKVTANANSNISETPDVQTKTYAVSSLTPYTDPNGTYTGTYKFAVKNAPAQITEKVTVALYASADAQEPVETITYSVKEYCDTVIEKSNDAKLVALCKSILDYGAAAQKEFDYNTDNMAVDTYYNADAIANLVYSDITDTLNYSSLPFTGIAFECLSTLNFNFYVNKNVNITEARVIGDEDSAIKATLRKSTKTGKLFVNVSGIEAGNLHNSFTVLTSEGSIETNLNTLVKTCLYYGSSVELAKTIYFYSNAANLYFN